MGGIHGVPQKLWVVIRRPRMMRMPS